MFVQNVIKLDVAVYYSYRADKRKNIYLATMLKQYWRRFRGQ